MNNNKIRCVILEDESLATQLLTDYISKHPDLELIATFDSPVDFIPKKDQIEFDLLFLDIFMPEMTGVELLQSFSLNCETIITTASPDHALDCYPLNVVDYLLKPIRLDRFMAATQKSVNLIRLKRNISPEQIKRTHIIVKADKRLIKVNIDDILYIEAAWEYVKIHTVDNVHMIMTQIKKMDAELKGYSFFRIHRSYLVNLDKIDYIEGSHVAIKKAKLPISRNYKQDLLQIISDQFRIN